MSDGTAEIVIPTGRNGFCCIVPCAFMSVMGAGTMAMGLLLARYLVRRRAAICAAMSGGKG